MEKELEYLGKALATSRKRHSLPSSGGAKVSDKIAVIHNLMTKVNALIVGGGMAYTFLKAQGQQIGKSLVEADKIESGSETAGRSQKTQSEIHTAARPRRRAKDRCLLHPSASSPGS